MFFWNNWPLPWIKIPLSSIFWTGNLEEFWWRLYADKYHLLMLKSLWKSLRILQELKSEFRTIDLYHSYLFAIMSDWSMFIVRPVSHLTSSKGQIISEAIFFGFNSSEKWTKYLQKFDLGTIQVLLHHDFDLFWPTHPPYHQTSSFLIPTLKWRHHFLIPTHLLIFFFLSLINKALFLLKKKLHAT